MDQLERIHEFISDYRKERGFSPSYREIMRGVGIGSTSTVQKRLMRMQSLGMISNGGMARTIVPLPRESWHEGS